MSERDEERPRADDAEADERASRPPTGDREREGSDDDGSAATDAPGPRGNPAVDEEGLRQHQQDRGD